MRPPHEDKMASVDYLTREWVGRLERQEAARLGTDLADARRRVARRLGIAPGTLENLRRGRTKGVRAWIADRINRDHARPAGRLRPVWGAALMAPSRTQLNFLRTALMQRIARRRQQHEPVAAEMARPQDATTKQLRAELRARKKERRDG